MRAVHVIISFALVTAFTLIVAASFIFVINRGNTNAHNSALSTLFQQTAADVATMEQDWVLLGDYRERVTEAFNDTAFINATLQADLAFLEAYVCQQYVRLNNETPGCDGAFFLNGTGNITINDDPSGNQIFVNGSALESQLDEDQALLTLITGTFAVTSLELSILNADSVKSINGVLVDPSGNIDVNGTCGVEVYPNNTIATCILEQNITALLVFLNQSYYLIVNETNAINGTMITLGQLLTDLQANISALDATLIKSINGQLPTNNVMNISAVAPYMVMDQDAPLGRVLVNSTGIVSINGVNLNRSVTIVDGPGIDIVLTPPNTITLSNTIADLFSTPCIMTVEAQTLFFGDGIFPPMYFNSYSPSGWQPFGVPTKTYPACPDVYSTFTSFYPAPPFFYYRHRWQQPVGVWQVRLNIDYTAVQKAVCPAGTCGITWGFALRDMVTADFQWFDSIYWNVGGAFFSNAGSFQGQLLMDGNVNPIGRYYEFVCIYFSTTGPFMNLYQNVQVTSIRVA
jgi:hypothetical protein